MGPQEADPTESGATHVPLRALPGLLQGGQGLQREIQIHLQDEDDGIILYFFIYLCIYIFANTSFSILPFLIIQFMVQL